jgi:hypothetical protein
MEVSGWQRHLSARRRTVSVANGISVSAHWIASSQALLAMTNSRVSAGPSTSLRAREAIQGKANKVSIISSQALLATTNTAAGFLVMSTHFAFA